MEKGGCYRYGFSFGKAHNTKSLNNGAAAEDGTYTNHNLAHLKI